MRASYDVQKNTGAIRLRLVTGHVLYMHPLVPEIYAPTEHCPRRIQLGPQARTAELADGFANQLCTAVEQFYEAYTARSPRRRPASPALLAAEAVWKTLDQQLMEQLDDGKKTFANAREQRELRENSLVF